MKIQKETPAMTIESLQSPHEPALWVTPLEGPEINGVLGEYSGQLLIRFAANKRRHQRSSRRPTDHFWQQGGCVKGLDDPELKDGCRSSV